MVDGLLLVLSPWAVRNAAIRRGARASAHGFDVDFALQARAAGRKVVTADLRVVHHRPLELIEDPDLLGRGPHRAGREVGRQAAGRRHRGPADWKDRARLAEAEREAARAAASPE